MPRLRLRSALVSRNPMLWIWRTLACGLWVCCALPLLAQHQDHWQRWLAGDAKIFVTRHGGANSWDESTVVAEAGTGRARLLQALRSEGAASFADVTPRIRLEATRQAKDEARRGEPAKFYPPLIPGGPDLATHASAAVRSAVAQGTAFDFSFPRLDFVAGSYGGRRFLVPSNHLGDDSAHNHYDTVSAVANGIVKFSGTASGYGRAVVIEHLLPDSSKVVSIYGHLCGHSGYPLIPSGSAVIKGQVIGYVGDDAENGDGAEHIHLGMRKNAYDGNFCGYTSPQCTAEHYWDPTVYINGHGQRIMLVGDWNGDGADAVWTFNGGQWTIPASDAGGTAVQFAMGIPGDLPVVGDWNNDGRDDPGIFRASQNPSTFYLDINHDAGADWVLALPGNYPQDMPVAGDWDGDSDTDVGAWDSNTRIFYLFRITGPSSLVDWGSPFQMGNPGDIPITGNWDGVGPTEVGVFRLGDPNASTNNFYFRKSDGTVVSLTALPGGMPNGWGNVGDAPLVGDWDNDGYDTIGLYRPSTQETFLNNDLPKFTPLGGPPPIPANFRVTGTAATTASLGWDDVTGEFGYRIYKWTGSTFALHTQLGPDITTYTDTALSCNSLYFYEVTAYNTSGESGHAAWVMATTQPCVGPPTPLNFRVTGTTATSARLAWDDVTGESGYRVYKWNGSAFSLHAQLGPDVTAHTDTGLTCNSQYFYEVSAYNTSGESGHTAWVTAATQSCGVVFQDLMESGANGWAGGWAQTTSASHSPTHSWTDSPGGNYPDNANNSLSSPAIDLGGLGSASLTFWHRFVFATGDGGNVWARQTTTGDYVWLGGFNGTAPGWRQDRFSLDAFLGQSIEIVFQLISDASTTADGWYIDDVSVGTLLTKGDMNSDGLPDLVFRSNTNGARNKVWFMDGVARTSEALVTPDAVSPDWRIRGVDDFNADGRNDLVFWHQATGNVEFWLMNGTSRSGSTVPLTDGPILDPSWDLAATADFNHDGKPDIVWRNFTSQKIVIWTMNGTAKLGDLIPTPDQAVSSNWIVVAALDYNNDGDTDFLWYNVTSGKIVTWYMDASVVRTTGQFTTPDAAGNNNWRVVASADFSRNYEPGTPPLGSPDVVWRNETSGSQVVWHLDFNSTRVHGEFTTPAANTPALDWTIVGPR